MSCVSADRTNSNEPDGAIRTLGDLLYSDPQQPRASEEEWYGLVRAIGAGEQVALRALYDRAHRIVFTLIMRISGNQQTAQELTLDVFHDVWRRAASYDPQNGPVLGWLMSQARSRAIDRLRYDQRMKRVVSHDQRPLMPGLASLAPDERKAIEATFFSELTCAEAATRLDQAPGTIASQIRSGLEKVRRAMELKMRMR